MAQLNTMEIVLADEHFRKFLALYGGSLEPNGQSNDDLVAKTVVHDSHEDNPPAAAQLGSIQDSLSMLDEGRRRHLAQFGLPSLAGSADGSESEVNDSRAVRKELGDLLWKEIPTMMAAHRRRRGQDQIESIPLDAFDVMRISAAVVTAAQLLDFVSLEVSPFVFAFSPRRPAVVRHLLSNGHTNSNSLS